MKKLLVLLLVLGMTSLASATAVSLTDEGITITATPGDLVFLTITSDAAVGILAFDVVISVNDSLGGTAANISDAMDGTMGSPDPDYQTTYGWDPTMGLPSLGVGTPTAEIGGANFGGNLKTIVGWVEVDYQGGTQLVDIAGGMAHGGHGDTGLTPLTFSPGIVTIIPEPMTIALLGLGGLALLRRRK